jgi:hypothetical protein
MCKPKDYYHEDSVYYIIQKKGWFGWKSLCDIYDGMWASHTGFSYWDTPEKFKTKYDAQLFLLTYYGRREAKPCLIV